MGASSVTGVGQGSAINAGGVKGPQNLRNQFASLFAPHVVHAGVVTLDTNEATVTFPAPLPGLSDNYVVMVMNVNATATNNVVISALNDDEEDNFAGFDVKGVAASDNVHWVVFKRGFGV